MSEAANAAVHHQRESQNNGRSGRRPGDDGNAFCARARVPANAIEGCQPRLAVRRSVAAKVALVSGAGLSGNQVARRRRQYAGDDERDERDQSARIGRVGDADGRPHKPIADALSCVEQERARRRAAADIVIGKPDRVDQNDADPDQCEVGKRTRQIQRRRHGPWPAKSRVSVL
jgi:hypothetical protein